MDYMSPQDKAHQLGVSLPTIRRMLSEGAFGDAAFKVRHKWRILATAMPANQTKQKIRPRWLTRSGEKVSMWERSHAPRMAEFVRNLIERVKPRFIIVRHRKGERVFAALKLIPEGYSPLVIELDFFTLMPEERRRDLLENGDVLILDDTIQRGRYISWMQSWLQDQAPGIRVFVGCLFLRRSCRMNGELRIPDVEAYQELDDYQYRLATAELSRVYRSIWPLDEEHPTIWARIPESLTEVEILKRLGILGPLVEFPSLTADKNVRVFVVEDIHDPSFKSLGLPRIAIYWPPKLRCLWLRDTRTLVLVGIWFPILEASIRWLRAYQPSQSEAWFPYLGLDDIKSWKGLTPEQRAYRLFRAFALYAGSRLVSVGFAAVASGSLDIPAGEYINWEPEVEDEDYIRVYGLKIAQQMITNIRAEVMREIERQRTASTFVKVPFVTPQIDKPVGDLTIREFIDPLAAVFQSIPEDEQRLLESGKGKYVYRADLETMFNQEIDRRKSLMEGLTPIGTFSNQLDVGLDYAFIAPTNELEIKPTAINVQRAFEPCEPLNERIQSEIDSTLIAKRLIYAVPLVIRHFQKILGARADIHRLIFHKLLVNIQANLVEGAINPREVSLERCLIFERGELLGPMSFTSPLLTPHDIVEIDRFLERRNILTIKTREDGRFINVSPSLKSEDNLARFEDLWREIGGSLLTDAEVLGSIYRNVKTTNSYGGPVAGDLLTALAACSNEDRFIHYAIEDIRIWKGAVANVVTFLTTPDFQTGNVEDDLNSLLTAASALSNKVEWYKSISEWRSELERHEAISEYGKLRLLRRIDPTPTWERNGQPRARLMLDIEPMVLLIGALLRFLTSELGIGGRFQKRQDGTVPHTGFDRLTSRHDLHNLPEVVLALQCQAPSELEQAFDGLHRLGTFRGDHMTVEISDAVAEVWKTVNHILAPILLMSPGVWNMAE